VFLPPQQSQSGAAAALQSLGGLASLAGVGGGGLKTPGDQFAAMLQTVNVLNGVVKKYELTTVYKADGLEETRQELKKNTRIELGKKDGLITVEVSDSDPKRAADIANQYVAELRRVTANLAITEAQQRRVFFDKQASQAKAALLASQEKLQGQNVNAATLKLEPKAAAEGYATIKAQLTLAEVRISSLQNTLTEDSPQMKAMRSNIAALRAQLKKAEGERIEFDGGNYTNAYRDYKYQEALYELFAKQLELARLDESRESALIQVIDVAEAPEKKSKPKRVILAIQATIATFFILLASAFVTFVWRSWVSDENKAADIKRLQQAWGFARD
jgi:uncharacterized protein involved in exopolysaccharide biosynthesis